MIALGILFIWNKLDSVTPLDIVNLYEEKWGIQLPLPEEMEEIWGSEASFNGDGEWVNVFYYNNDNPQMQDSGMSIITEENLESANSRIEKFKSNTIALYFDEKTTKIKSLFEQHPVEVQLDDYYFYKAKNGHYDYFIVVYKKDEQKLYTFEWHQ